MIDQSTNRVLEEELLSLFEGVAHYYIKSPSIVEKISFKGRDFYSKYRRVDERPNKIVLSQHLKRELKIALPLADNQIFIRYFGSDRDKFLYLLDRLIDKVSKRVLYYQSKIDTLDILIFLDSKDKSYKIASEIDSRLREFLSIEWKTLPDRRLPKSYNIFPLPNEIY